MAGQTFLFGVNASITWLSGNGASFNFFTYGQSQSVAEATAFGMRDAVVEGGVMRGAGTVGGVNSFGTSNDTLAPVASNLIQFNRDPAAITLTYGTNCTVAASVVVSNLNTNVAYESAQGRVYSFVKSGPATLAWVTS